jgi:hypothetical protein
MGLLAVRQKKGLGAIVFGSSLALGAASGRGTQEVGVEQARYDRGRQKSG